MVPLVFKTSLGVVRFPEGSTPSLLRQALARLASVYATINGNFCTGIEYREICLTIELHKSLRDARI